ncbi:unnamed protein product [Rhodiola kirilowii]
MYEYVEKFNALEKSCCNLGLTEKLLVEYMLDGLRRLDRKLLDASAGGNLMNLSPTKVRRKIMEVAESERFQDESNKDEEFTRTRNVLKVEPQSSTMAAEIKELKEMMQHVIRRQPVQTKPCRFCAATDHKTDECTSIMEDDQAEVNANQRPYQPPHRQYQQNGPSQFQQRGPSNNQTGPSNHGPNKSLEDIVKELAASTQQLATTVHQNQARTDGAIADLSRQMSQIATTVSELKNDTDGFPHRPFRIQKGMSVQ